MTTRTEHIGSPRWVIGFLSALGVVLAAILSSAAASAATDGVAETRVRAYAQEFTVLVGPSDRITAVQRQGNNPIHVEVVVATGVAANSGREVILDTNAVFRWREVRGMLRTGDTPVITRTTQAELRNLAAAGRMKTPGYMADFGVIDDVMDVNSRINIRGAMRPGQPGLFGDGSIGATVLSRGSSLVTFDRNFAEVMRRLGADVL